MIPSKQVSQGPTYNHQQFLIKSEAPHRHGMAHSQRILGNISQYPLAQGLALCLPYGSDAFIWPFQSLASLHN